MDGAGGSLDLSVGDVAPPNPGPDTGTAATPTPIAPTTPSDRPHGPATAAPNAPKGPVTHGSGGVFKRATTGNTGDWWTWWSWNSEPYLRTGLVASFAATPGPADVASCDLTPKLAALLVGDDWRLVASGLVALARATPASQRERVAALVRTRLDHEQLLVREAAIVAAHHGDLAAPAAAERVFPARAVASPRCRSD